MRKALTIVATLLLASTAFADTFRVHYSIRGSGRSVTVQAESSSEARRTVMDMFPGAEEPAFTGSSYGRRCPSFGRWFCIHFVRIDNGADLCFWLARDAREFSKGRPVFPSTNNLESFHY